MSPSKNRYLKNATKPPLTRCENLEILSQQKKMDNLLQHGCIFLLHLEQTNSTLHIKQYRTH